MRTSARENIAIVDASGWAALAAWIGLIPVGFAAVRAYLNAGVADERARRAEERAEEAGRQFTRMADALDRLADRNAGTTLLPGGDTSARVEFQVERRGQDAYALRNLGPEPATNVSIEPIGAAGAGDLLAGVDLAPLQSHHFRLGEPGPSAVLVTCDQLEDATSLPVPQHS